MDEARARELINHANSRISTRGLPSLVDWPNSFREGSEEYRASKIICEFIYQKNSNHSSSISRIYGNNEQEVLDKICPNGKTLQ